MGICALVAASDFNASFFEKRYHQGAFERIVAVDAGFAHLAKLGVSPDAALGDFDSLGYVPHAPQVIEHPAHKDQSDLELALGYVAQSRCDHVEIYGALGGRLDHTLANLQIFARFAERGMQVEAIDMNAALRVLVGPAAFNLPVLESGVVSVFAACDEVSGVTERGLEYPLEDAVLTNRTSLGLSNELTGIPASVSVREGTLYVFYPLY